MFLALLFYSFLFFSFLFFSFLFFSFLFFSFLFFSFLFFSFLFFSFLFFSFLFFSFLFFSLFYLQDYENKKDKTDEDMTTAAEAITANLTNAQNVIGIVNRFLTPNRRGRILFIHVTPLNFHSLIVFELHRFIIV